MNSFRTAVSLAVVAILFYSTNASPCTDTCSGQCGFAQQACDLTDDGRLRRFLSYCSKTSKRSVSDASFACWNIAPVLDNRLKPLPSANYHDCLLLQLKA
ncbi:hypothetical protein ElyMa_000166100 [Elysia marginata]|uniref:Uncharacterized protein n=1 Tax=Elysia marginata TaxID=1093978 RepID=A0AAV4ETQ2_9GAST|nr:hypothetical protein ElyMa_000166100 [Elysia marginata]